ncbi:methionine adenosyltransferase [Streptomyces sp. NPDC001389]|uniref:methionine adenosyltransferase n=1 Tax=Streptomyces sp. NPDC001389 TaxID=3364569 RepID=UPI0036A28B64
MSTEQLATRSVPRPHEAGYEVVERKGIGHPDTLADGIAELASIRYAQFCEREFGVIPHHNLDKVAVFGGRVLFGDNDGEFVRPVRVIFGGRASTSFGGKPIPVREILEAAAHEQLRTALPGYARTPVEVRHETTDSSKFPHWFTPRGVEDLPETRSIRASDTAFLVGSAPYTKTETAAVLAESFMQSHPWTGSDIKVLATRTGTACDLTLCVPVLAGSLSTSAEFHELLNTATGDLLAMLSEALPGPVRVRCNTRGNTAAPPLSCQYFTVSGSAIDYGEDGMVGRGNARSGLISPLHVAGNEALFGKNPTYQVGKVGAWLVDQAAAELSRRFGPSRVSVSWATGTPYSDPAFTDIACDGDPAEADEIVMGALARTDWLPSLVAGERYRPAVRPYKEIAAELLGSA